MKELSILINRVSDPSQKEGYSLSAQSRKGKDYLASKQFDMITEFTFQESASKATEQKKFDEIMSFIYSHISKHKQPLNIVIEKKDRWGRLHSRKEIIQGLVLEGKVKVHYYRENQIFDKYCSPEDIFMDDVVTSMNKYVALNIGREAKKGLLEKAKQGWLPHKPPFGYINNPNKNATEAIIVNEKERPLIYRIFELRGTKEYSYAAICELVVAENLVPTKRLKAFRKSTVEKILKHPFHYGKFVFGGQEYDGNHELIVTPNIRTKVKALFNTSGTLRKRKQDGAFSGFLTCGECGCKVTYHQKKKPSGNIYHLYVCANGKKAHSSLRGMYYKEEELFKKFESAVDSFSITDDLAKDISNALNQNHIALQIKLRKEESSYKTALKRLEYKEDELYDDLKKGLIGEDTYKRRIGIIRKERDKYADLLIEIEASANDTYMETAKDILELANNAKSLWSALPKHDRVEVLKKVLWNPKITGLSIEYHLKKPFDALSKMRGNLEWGG